MKITRECMRCKKTSKLQIGEGSHTLLQYYLCKKCCKVEKKGDEANMKKLSLIDNIPRYNKITLATRRGRFRFQRIVYLLKALHYPPVQKYKFDLYLRGSYSSDLAEIYHKIQDKDMLSEFNWIKNIPPRMGRVIQEAFKHSDNFLEIITVLHSVWNHNQTLEERKIIDHVKKLKPSMVNIIEEGWEFLKTTKMVQR